MLHWHILTLSVHAWDTFIVLQKRVISSYDTAGCVHTLCFKWNGRGPPKGNKVSNAWSKSFAFYCPLPVSSGDSDSSSHSSALWHKQYSPLYITAHHAVWFLLWSRMSAAPWFQYARAEQELNSKPWQCCAPALWFMCNTELKITSQGVRMYCLHIRLGYLL